MRHFGTATTWMRLRNCLIAGNEKCAPQKSTKFEGTFANELSRQQLLIPHLSRWADGNMVTQTSVSGAVGSSGLIWKQFLLQVTQQKEQNICFSRHIAYKCTWYAKAVWFIELYLQLYILLQYEYHVSFWIDAKGWRKTAVTVLLRHNGASWVGITKLA